MLHRLNDLVPRSALPQPVAIKRERTSEPPHRSHKDSEPRPTYAKVFRWRLPPGQTAVPNTVEVIGSFTEWKPVPLLRASGRDSWEVTVPEIAGHRTHHYMLLVDGLPTQDKNCDGLAIPHGPEEQQYALSTPRGPRLFMLFAQAK